MVPIIQNCCTICIWFYCISDSNASKFTWSYKLCGWVCLGVWPFWSFSFYLDAMVCRSPAYSRKKVHLLIQKKNDESPMLFYWVDEFWNNYSYLILVVSSLVDFLILTNSINYSRLCTNLHLFFSGFNIQLLVFTWHAESKNSLKVDHSFLGSSYHSSIISGLSLVASVLGAASASGEKVSLMLSIRIRLSSSWSS
jgi:hypothetical protein